MSSRQQMFSPSGQSTRFMQELDESLQFRPSDIHRSPTRLNSSQRLSESRQMQDLQVDKEVYERRNRELQKTNAALQEELESLVQRLQAKSSRIIELTNSNKRLNATLIEVEGKKANTRQDNLLLQDDNTKLMQRVHELEDVGREMNNQTLEQSIREKELETEIRMKQRELQGQQEELDRNRSNASLLERKIEELRRTTSHGLQSRDDIIQRQTNEISRLASRVQELQALAQADADSYTATARQQQSHIANVERERSKYAEDYELLRVENASLRAQVTAGKQEREALQKQSMVEREAHKHEMNIVQQRAQEMEFQMSDEASRAKRMSARLELRTQEQKALIGEQQRKLNESQNLEDQWAKKLLRQELLFEQEKQDLEEAAHCRACPKHRTTIRKLKAKNAQITEQVRLLTLSLPKRHNCQVHNPHWVPPGKKSTRV